MRFLQTFLASAKLITFGVELFHTIPERVSNSGTCPPHKECATAPALHHETLIQSQSRLESYLLFLKGKTIRKSAHC